MFAVTGSTAWGGTCTPFKTPAHNFSGRAVIGATNPTNRGPPATAKPHKVRAFKNGIYVEMMSITFPIAQSVHAQRSVSENHIFLPNYFLHGFRMTH